MTYEDNEDYDDIINLEHPEPKTRPRMPRQNRAAQFAPFAALEGYSEAIKRTEQLHEEQYTEKPISMEEWIDVCDDLDDDC